MFFLEYGDRLEDRIDLSNNPAHLNIDDIESFGESVTPDEILLVQGLQMVVSAGKPLIHVQDIGARFRAYRVPE